MRGRLSAWIGVILNGVSSSCLSQKDLQNKMAPTIVGAYKKSKIRKLCCYEQTNPESRT